MSGPKTAPEVAATRAGRQARIVAILSSKSVRSQSELAAMLAAEGIDVFGQDDGHHCCHGNTCLTSK